MASDDFYVGYLPMPEGLKRFARVLVVSLAAALALLGGVVAALQRPSPSGVFEYGVERQFEGILFERPVPVLRVHHQGGAESFLLVGFGKFGLPEFARGADRRRVRFSGSLIYREGLTMVEMNDPQSFEVLGEPPTGDLWPEVEVIGPVELVGELVDTKCYFGVMRPATGKVHRACAVRCLSGGVPPGLLVRDHGDDGMVFMLVGQGSAPLAYDVEWAARTVRAAGTLELHDGIPVVRVRSLAPID